MHDGIHTDAKLSDLANDLVIAKAVAHIFRGLRRQGLIEDDDVMPCLGKLGDNVRPIRPTPPVTSISISSSPYGNCA
jgi:hypothetical protein